MMRTVAWIAPLALFALACGDDEGPLAAPTATSAATSSSATSSTSSVGGAGGAPAQGGAGGALTGGAGGEAPMEIGALSGTCGALEPADLVASAPAFKIDNELDFGMMAMAEPDPATLASETKAVYDAGNLGGSSIWSEVFAFDVLRRCELATLQKTEAEIVYQDPGGKKTDILVTIDGATIGVSVTRAYHFPPEEPYTVAEAQALLEDKLADIHLSTANVAPRDAWQKQILHVIAYEPDYVTALDAAWALVDPAIKGDTIVIVTLTSGDDAFIY